jgi:hypothetical protein
VADGDIDAFADEVDGVVGQRDIELHIREKLLEFAGERQDIPFSEADRSVDRQRPARQRAAAAGDHLFRVGDLGQDALRPRQIGLPLRRQLQHAGGTDHEARAEPVLQPGDQLADRGRGEFQLSPRGGKALELGGQRKDFHFTGAVIHRMFLAFNFQNRRHRGSRPSALPGISPTGGEIASGATVASK